MEDATALPAIIEKLKSCLFKENDLPFIYSLWLSFKIYVDMTIIIKGEFTLIIFHSLNSYTIPLDETDIQGIFLFRIILF
jgi:hypothetical protein